MGVERIVKPEFTVIGMEGSTNDGEGFIAKLWDLANARFSEIADLCKRDERGGFVGFWGAMSDFSRGFRPWEDFANGLYLAGAECANGAEPPAGWTKWVVPGFEYLRFAADEYQFDEAIAFVRDNGFSLAGAAHDFTDPKTGKSYICIPVRKL